MRLPLTAIAGLLLTIASAGFAEPPKTAQAKPAQPQPPRVQVVLASADSVPSRTPDSANVVPAPVKRPVAPRVTTCRCGDPQVDAETEQQ